MKRFKLYNNKKAQSIVSNLITFTVSLTEKHWSHTNLDIDIEFYSVRFSCYVCLMLSVAC